MCNIRGLRRAGRGLPHFAGEWYHHDPLRFLPENLDYTVTWDQEAQTAFIET